MTHDAPAPIDWSASELYRAPFPAWTGMRCSPQSRRFRPPSSSWKYTSKRLKRDCTPSSA